MRLLFFTSLKGFHGRKWLKSLAIQHEVHVATFRCDQEDKIPGVIVHEIQKGTVSHHKKEERTKVGKLKLRAEAWLTLKIGIRFASRFAKLIDDIKPDLVHAHQSVPFGWYAARAVTKSKHKSPLIVSTWGTDVIGYPNKSILYRILNRLTLRKANYLSATGTFLGHSTRRWSGDKPIYLIPFGIEPDKFAAKKSAPKAIRTFGIAKQLKPVYRIDYLIRALAMASKTNPNLRLEIAGDGPLRDELKILAHNLKVDGKVTFLGMVASADMPTVLARWDCVINPTEQESFGVLALEAQAVGTPIIANATGGLPEVTIPNQTALLINDISPSKIAQALNDGHRFSKLAQDALLLGPKFVADKYDWQSNLRQMNALYVKAIEEVKA